jgi:ribonuclease HII
MLRRFTRHYPCVVTLLANDLLEYERPLLARGEIVVGIDEVGRGALAGPLVVGAVVVNNASAPPIGLNDSKALSSRQREALEAPLQQWAAEWSLGSASAFEIDQWGLRLALAVAANRALEALRVTPTHALIDGSFNLLNAPLDVPFGSSVPPELRFRSLASTTIVKGDSRSAAIAGASVLAKVDRDRTMVALHDCFPRYRWAGNKGYGAPEHLAALRQFGPCEEHRQSWNLPPRTTLKPL